ncbi:cytochrome bd ubiquinol oxidase subunit I [Desulfovibrio sp. X2]|uniref:cytochrome ubiquinol oxidase subunit I n=1 Tax=Desulfovibrio sp. X2 TaxID=941449 RepID=UPI0003587C5D|nr:cytochrome ubiquinol oxidase subunit I [Desulfovibrio sp. X2]EPR43554.1 cytochrome bd ubiquinol oxidase subunit I [Desulfovibrio sp. X2]
MDFLGDHVFLSRLQFAATTMFHIAWPLLTIGLSIFLFTTEALWLRTREPAYYHHTRFWTKLFILNFAVGVASGIPLEFQFGTNWSAFSAMTGNFFGQILGFEGAMAFMLEAAFLYIMVYGWEKVSAGMHLFATGMVALGASLSAFWIMVANSWMHTPRGGFLSNKDGIYHITDWAAAVFTPDLFPGFGHMWLACLETSLFVIGGISAWYILRGVKTEFFLRSLKLALVAAVLVAPLQVLMGDRAGRMVTETQPAKLAALEAHWHTNAPGEGAPWAVVAWPDSDHDRNSFEIAIPYALSLLLTSSPTGRVVGLSSFPPEDRPPIVVPFYAFRVMMAIGFAMVLLMFWTLWVWRKGGLSPERAAGSRTLLRAWVVMAPLGYLATETGWVTREVGRQPWVLYNLIRTSEGASILPPAAVGWSLAAYLAVYTVLLGIFLWYARKLLLAGPDTTLPLPRQAASGPGRGGEA